MKGLTPEEEEVLRDCLVDDGCDLPGSRGYWMKGTYCPRLIARGLLTMRSFVEVDDSGEEWDVNEYDVTARGRWLLGVVAAMRRVEAA